MTSLKRTVQRRKPTSTQLQQVLAAGLPSVEEQTLASFQHAMERSIQNSYHQY